MGTALIIWQITAFILKESGVFGFSGKRKYQSEEVVFQAAAKSQNIFLQKRREDIETIGD